MTLCRWAGEGQDSWSLFQAAGWWRGGVGLSWTHPKGQTTVVESCGQEYVVIPRPGARGVCKHAV